MASRRCRFGDTQGQVTCRAMQQCGYQTVVAVGRFVGEGE
jgi:hypothetical protein